MDGLHAYQTTPGEVKTNLVYLRLRATQEGLRGNKLLQLQVVTLDLWVDNLCGLKLIILPSSEQFACLWLW